MLLYVLQAANSSLIGCEMVTNSWFSFRLCKGTADSMAQWQRVGGSIPSVIISRSDRTRHRTRHIFTYSHTNHTQPYTLASYPPSLLTHSPPHTLFPFLLPAVFTCLQPTTFFPLLPTSILFFKTLHALHALPHTSARSPLFLGVFPSRLEAFVPVGSLVILVNPFVSDLVSNPPSTSSNVRVAGKDKAQLAHAELTNQNSQEATRDSVKAGDQNWQARVILRETEKMLSAIIKSIILHIKRKYSTTDSIVTFQSRI